VAASNPRTLGALWHGAMESRIANVRLLQAFAAAALTLCTIGIYAVAALAARSRRRELAIRAALGASRRRLTVSVLRRELQPILGGLGAGLLLALVFAPMLFEGVFGIATRDTATYWQVSLLLSGTSLIALCVPLWRAGSAKPADLLAD
jgi:ABC-type antimicrobial peptide transport system permease subunit